MNINNFFKTLLLVCCVSSSVTCNKLEETAFSQSSPDNFFGSQNEVTAALVGMYRPLQVCCGGYQQSWSFALNTVSDEGDSDQGWGEYDDLTYTATSAGDAHTIWGTSFISISAANFVIDNEAKIELVDNTPGLTFTKESLAEAHFMRALNYFNLVRVFGGVPLRTSVTERADDVNLPRNSEEEVYTQIISDFKYAEANLPEVVIAGKPYKMAATAFLAKVYLTMKDFANALSHARTVVTSGRYSLMPSFAEVFDINKENNAEVIFDIQFVRIDGQGMRMQYLFTGPDTKLASGASGGWGLASLQNGLFEKYAPNDDRIGVTFSNPVPGQATYYTGKWRDPEASIPDGHENNFIVYRYADLLLILAEAENEINGPTQAAYDEIQKVRDRAGLGDLPAALSQDQFRDAVIQERHLELSFEQHRWFDLKRTDKLKSTMIATGKAWNDRYYLFPIPQSEIDASNGVIEQNPGY